MFSLDLAVIAAYFALIVGLGLWLARDTRHSEDFMAAHRALPGWAIGLSIFGSYISSISFLANPGKSFSGDWVAFAFSLTTPLAALVAVRWFVPFYRAGGYVSAYEHLETRFGPWARTYAVVCFLLTQVARMGTIVYLLALAVAPITGWPVHTIIYIVGGAMTIYTALGGIKAAVWTGVVQSFILLAGPIICLVYILAAMPGGAAEVLEIAGKHGKFSLGDMSLSLAAQTFWVTLIYGLVINVQNFAVDQSYVQRYITARSDADARRSVWLGAWLYVPVAAVFFFIGTALFALSVARPEYFPSGLKGDEIFPHFIATALPAGLRGLVIAALLAAAMDSSLSSMATLTYRDLYQRYFRPQASDHEALRVLNVTTLAWGVAGTLVALAMTRARTVLDVWWDLAGVFGGGVLGLFLLGFVFRKATNFAAACGTVAGVTLILWMTFSPKFTTCVLPWRSPLHNLWVIVLGTATILVVGVLASALQRAVAPAEQTS